MGTGRLHVQHKCFCKFQKFDEVTVFLNKDCNLIEFLEFTKAFVLYMQSSGTTIPRDAVFSHLRVQVDAWWQHYIEYVGLTINSDISHFIKIMDTAARNKFPIHARRMKVFSHVHKGEKTQHLVVLLSPC